MFNFIVKIAILLIGAKGTRLMRERESKGNPTGLFSEEASGPPVVEINYYYLIGQI